MRSCRDIEPLLAVYEDGEAAPADREAVRAHLDACQACREAAASVRTAREVLTTCRERLRSCAPEALRARCAREGANAVPARPTPDRWHPALSGWRTLVPLSVAASILLAVAGVFVYSAVNQAEALAAQLAFDHAKCAKVGSPGLGDPHAEAARWHTSNGWPVRVAASTAEHDLEFLTIRRCLVTDGRTAHLMYKWRGRPLSVFVLPNAVESVHAQHMVERFGYEAIMWSSDGRTYVVVADAPRGDIEPVVRYVRANTR